MKIAICDDEKVAAEYIGEVLETYFKDKSMEYSIELYNSGETLMALQDKIMTYDVVFLDVDMPDADGFPYYLYEEGQTGDKIYTKITLKKENIIFWN